MVSVAIFSSTKINQYTTFQLYTIVYDICYDTSDSRDMYSKCLSHNVPSSLMAKLNFFYWIIWSLFIWSSGKHNKRSLTVKTLSARRIDIIQAIFETFAEERILNTTLLREGIVIYRWNICKEAARARIVGRGIDVTGDPTECYYPGCLITRNTVSPLLYDMEVGLFIHRRFSSLCCFIWRK